MEESQVLFCTEGSSDKEYRVQLEKADQGFSVKFQFGRRGQAMKSGSKTSFPVAFEQAKLIFDKLIREKLAKGYSMLNDQESQRYVQADAVRPSSHFLPQLLNEVAEIELDYYLDSPEWLLQAKMDGERRSIQLSSENIVGINRKGFSVDLPANVVADIQKSAFMALSPCIIDGEMVGEHFYAFDVFLYESNDFAQQVVLPLIERMRHLFKVAASANVSLVEFSLVADQKRKMMKMLQNNKKEGIVLKHVDASYCPGRPNSLGTWLKFKFVSTASCIVVGINMKRSVALGLFDENGFLVNVGNVTVPVNQEVPHVDQIVETRYLYAFKQGSLFQPVLLGVRNDVDASACTTSQLKYKPE